MAEIKEVVFKSKDKREFIIRHGVESDAELLIACATKYIEDGDGQVMVPGEFKMNEEKEREWIKGLRENPDEILLIAIYDNQVIGNIDFHVGKRQRTSHVGEFGMGIAKEWRSRGVGSALLSQLIKWAKENQNIKKINLYVLADNIKAIGLYKKFGFKEEGFGAREIKISQDIYVDNIKMALFVQ